jgi:hypothetical protein
VWRWWIFDGKDAHHSDTGVIAGTGRDQAEAAAMNAIEQRRGRNPARRTDGTVLGVVGHTTSEDPAASGQGHHPDAHLALRSRIRSVDDNASACGRI